MLSPTVRLLAKLCYLFTLTSKNPDCINRPEWGTDLYHLGLCKLTPEYWYNEWICLTMRTSLNTRGKVHVQKIRENKLWPGGEADSFHPGPPVGGRSRSISVRSSSAWPTKWLLWQQRVLYCDTLSQKSTVVPKGRDHQGPSIRKVMYQRKLCDISIKEGGCTSQNNMAH